MSAKSSTVSCTFSAPAADGLQFQKISATQHDLQLSGPTPERWQASQSVTCGLRIYQDPFGKDASLTADLINSQSVRRAGKGIAGLIHRAIKQVGGRANLRMAKSLLLIGKRSKTSANYISAFMICFHPFHSQKIVK